MTDCWRTWDVLMQTFSTLMPQHCQGVFVHTWDKASQEEPALMDTLPKGPRQTLSLFSDPWVCLLVKWCFCEAFLLSSNSWLLSKVTALIPTLVGPVAGFRLGFFPVRPIASTCPLEENNALAHFFLVLEYFSGCYKLPSDDQQHYYFYRPEIGMQNLHPHYQPTLFSLF